MKEIDEMVKSIYIPSEGSHAYFDYKKRKFFIVANMELFNQDMFGYAKLSRLGYKWESGHGRVSLIKEVNIPIPEEIKKKLDEMQQSSKDNKKDIRTILLIAIFILTILIVLFSILKIYILACYGGPPVEGETIPEWVKFLM